VCAVRLTLVMATLVVKEKHAHEHVPPDPFAGMVNVFAKTLVTTTTGVSVNASTKTNVLPRNTTAVLMPIAKTPTAVSYVVANQDLWVMVSRAKLKLEVKPTLKVEIRM